MRIIHTADWHLGRALHGVNLIEDQAYVLDQLVDLVKDLKPDIVIVAGDIYDRALPSVDAVNLLDDVLFRIVSELHTPTMLISGNHDSPGRLSFAGRMLGSQGLFIISSLQKNATPIPFTDVHGTVWFYPIPYTEPSLASEYLSEPCNSHEAAMEALTTLVRKRHPKNARSVVIAHAFVTGGEACESERPLAVGGQENIQAHCFREFDYVALGHLHQRQSVNGCAAQYSGSILKYSFSEVAHVKSVTLIELDEKGGCILEDYPLQPKKDTRVIKGVLGDLLSNPLSMEHRHDYISATILDEGPVLDAVGQLRRFYPNVLHIDRPFLTGQTISRSAGESSAGLSHFDLFKAFFLETQQQELNQAQSTAYQSTVEAWHMQEREAN